MTITRLSSIVGAIAVLLGAVFAIDTRYAHGEDVKREQQSMQAQQQQDFKQLKLEILRQRIAFLNNKAALTQDEKDELEFSRELAKKLQAELLK